MIRTAFKRAMTLVMGTCLLSAACGKKAETNDSSPGIIVAPPQTATDAYMEKQDVTCEQNQACPSFISKIVVTKGDKYEFCTGFLIDKDVVATSTSCLPNLMRLVGSDCSRDVFFFFPRSGNRPAEKVGCSKVLQVSQIDGQDPIYWRDDLSLLQLSKPLVGRKVSYARNGLSNNKAYYTYMVDQQGDYSAIIKRVTCNAIHQNYVNPLASNESSPNAVFADCPFTNGGTGAPILDGSGKVRAVVSVPMLKTLRDYLLSCGLLTNGLKEMLHATNLACAPILNDLDMLDEKECQKDLTETKVDKARAEMLSPTLLFSEFRKRLEDSLEKTSKFIKFGVKLISQNDTQKTEIYPKCFKPYNTWLPGMENTRTYTEDIKLPVTSFKRVMDNVGRIQGLTINDNPVPYKLQFSARTIRNTGASTVFMWIPGKDGTPYPALTEDCSASLP